MTEEQLQEAMRLASMMAMKRVRRYAIQKGSSLTTIKTANESVEKARKELHDYLQQFVKKD
jgi:adenylate kinase